VKRKLKTFRRKRTPARRATQRPRVSQDTMDRRRTKGRRQKTWDKTSTETDNVPPRMIPSSPSSFWIFPYEQQQRQQKDFR
jgi:hypothetical protein